MKVLVARWSQELHDECYGVFRDVDSFLRHIKEVDIDWYKDSMEYYDEMVDAGQDPSLDEEYIEDYFGITLEKHEVQL